MSPACLLIGNEQQRRAGRRGGAPSFRVGRRVLGMWPVFNPIGVCPLAFSTARRREEVSRSPCASPRRV